MNVSHLLHTVFDSTPARKEKNLRPSSPSLNQTQALPLFPKGLCRGHVALCTPPFYKILPN